MYLLPGLGGVGLCYGPCVSWASLVAQMVKHLHTIQETLVPTRGWEDPLEKGMATDRSLLAWRIAWTEEPGRLKSIGTQRFGHN